MTEFWYAQRGEADNAIAAIKNLFHLLKVRISNTTIDSTFRSHPSYPALSANNICSLLDNWDFQTRVVSIGMRELNDLYYKAFPVIAFVEEKVDDTMSGCFVVLTRFSDEHIQYIHPRYGWLVQTHHDFNKVWSGHLLLAMLSDKSQEPDYEKKVEQEKADKQADDGVKIIDNFLTDEECDTVIELANPIFKPSPVVNERGNSDGRTSFSAALTEPHKVLKGIHSKVAKLLNVPENHVEHLQCVSYEGGQYYGAHYDTMVEGTDNQLKECGNRSHTVLVYLNDDFDGGQTHFPYLDKLVDPKKGRAVVWSNITPGGKIDPKSFHAGLPVVRGKKYGCNIWVRNHPIR